VVDHCCELLDALEGPIDELDAEILRQAKHDPRVEALRTLPGVGPVVAMTLVAEIGDISRFPTARKLCAWAGLTPTVRNSDLKVRHGHITKAGPASVRWVLTEATHVARRYPAYAATFDRIAARRGTPIATVALSRRLLSRCFHILASLEVGS
jgi:transposase